MRCVGIILCMCGIAGAWALIAPQECEEAMWSSVRQSTGRALAIESARCQSTCLAQKKARTDLLKTRRDRSHRRGSAKRNASCQSAPYKINKRRRSAVQRLEDRPSAHVMAATPRHSVSMWKTVLVSVLLGTAFGHAWEMPGYRLPEGKGAALEVSVRTLAAHAPSTSTTARPVRPRWSGARRYHEVYDTPCQKALENAESGDTVLYTRTGRYWKQQADNWATLRKTGADSVAIRDQGGTWTLDGIKRMLDHWHYYCCAAIGFFRESCDHVLLATRTGMRSVSCGPCF